MNALADAAFLSSNGPAMNERPAYSRTELQALDAMGLNAAMGPVLGAAALPTAISSAVMTMPNRGLMPSQLPGPGRHLQILDHTVHRIDTHTRNNGEEEKEMVVSNLRHFTLKIGVLDPRMGVGREAELPLRAELLYENGQLVEQLATCEPLLVGKTEVVAMQGIALFKLRITSLSSHRDKQRFRIRVSPVDTNLLLREPGLSVVTTPMKCVTKLSHRAGASCKLEGGADGAEDAGEEADEWDEGAPGPPSSIKRKRDELEPLLDAQGAQLQQLQETSSQMMEQLRALKQLLSSAVPQRH